MTLQWVSQKRKGSLVLLALLSNPISRRAQVQWMLSRLENGDERRKITGSLGYKVRLPGVGLHRQVALERSNARCRSHAAPYIRPLMPRAQAPYPPFESVTINTVWGSADSTRSSFENDDDDQSFRPPQPYKTSPRQVGKQAQRISGATEDTGSKPSSQGHLVSAPCPGLCGASRRCGFKPSFVSGSALSSAAGTTHPVRTLSSGPVGPTRDRDRSSHPTQHYRPRRPRAAVLGRSQRQEGHARQLVQRAAQHHRSREPPPAPPERPPGLHNAPDH